ncbi:MAG: pectinesterase [Deltaproteobacteria bacterium]|jgi:hypothetical protein|nr:pectinesterase [Deltaproteobacteria bacterium]MBW2533873.1 pectinesterase [Deltaproteobacteria bacterium]
MLRRTLSLLWVGALAGGLIGCSSDDETTPGDGQPTLPTLAELSPGWNVLEPGGDTICGRGAPFAFFVRPGTVDRVVLEFEDGGACWSADTCSVEADLFDDEVELGIMDVPEGIHDHDNPQNPFADWHHIFVANCTGDLMIGSKTTSYVDFSVNHMGKVNAEAAVNWMYENFPNPERVFVTGCSAGGYASLDWAPWVMDHYDGVSVSQLSDCAVGAQPGGILAVFNEVWGVEHIAPSFIPALSDPDWLNLELYDIYIADANHFADQQFGQYNSQFDPTQIKYYQEMGGGDAAEWSAYMNDSVTTIASAASNFAYYTAAGNNHCIVDKPEVYTVETGGTSFLDWMADVATGTTVSNVHCDPDCGTP